jgi:hypothetical protein
MPKGKAKSKYNYEIDPKTGKEFGCEFEKSGWCHLPKGKRCDDCIRTKDGNGCYVMV